MHINSGMMADVRRQLKPEILSFTTTTEVNELFDLYFDRMHTNLPLLNRQLHTPAAVCARSPFLLTTVCAIASRFYEKNLSLRPKLAVVAKKLMFESPARGYKSLEIVQAYLLLTNWNLGPEERWEQDLSYLLLGLAIRIATDLNLYKKNVVMPLDTEEGRIRDIGESDEQAKGGLPERLIRILFSQKSPIEKGHGLRATFLTGRRVRKWANPTLFEKTLLSAIQSTEVGTPDHPLNGKMSY